MYTMPSQQRLKWGILAPLLLPSIYLELVQIIKWLNQCYLEQLIGILFAGYEVVGPNPASKREKKKCMQTILKIKNIYAYT